MDDSGYSCASVSDRKAKNLLTKTKYNQIYTEMKEKYSENLGSDIIDDIMEIICNIVKFDPSVSGYNRERVVQLMQTTGKTSYELFEKKYYDKNREEIRKVNAERQRRRRAAIKAAQQ